MISISQNRRSRSADLSDGEIATNGLRASPRLENLRGRYCCRHRRSRYCWIIGAGYRTLDVDYSKTGQFGILERSVWDLSYSGPRIWVVYTW